jgi:hypothetical protein
MTYFKLVDILVFAMFILPIKQIVAQLFTLLHTLLVRPSGLRLVLPPRLR